MVVPGEGQPRKKEKTSLSFEVCGQNNNFNYKDKEAIKLYGLDQYYCLTDTNYTIQGNFYYQAMDYVEVKLYKCKNGSSHAPPGVICKPESVIDAYFEDETFSMPFVNSVFIQDNYEEPI